MSDYEFKLTLGGFVEFLAWESKLLEPRPCRKNAVIISKVPA